MANNIDSLTPQLLSIPQLFEFQVEQTPDSIAVIFEGESLTYRELNHRANKEVVNNSLNYKARLTVDLLLSNFRI
jgi:non-ribosomal peptide synthetase component F